MQATQAPPLSSKPRLTGEKLVRRKNVAPNVQIQMLSRRLLFGSDIPHSFRLWGRGE